MQKSPLFVEKLLKVTWTEKAMVRKEDAESCDDGNKQKLRQRQLDGEGTSFTPSQVHSKTHSCLERDKINFDLF